MSSFTRVDDEAYGDVHCAESVDGATQVVAGIGRLRCGDLQRRSTTCRPVAYPLFRNDLFVILKII